jgi:hypothetical protein
MSISMDIEGEGGQLISGTRETPLVTDPKEPYTLICSILPKILSHPPRRSLASPSTPYPPPPHPPPRPFQSPPGRTAGSRRPRRCGTSYGLMYTAPSDPSYRQYWKNLERGSEEAKRRRGCDWYTKVSFQFHLRVLKDILRI